MSRGAWVLVCCGVIFPMAANAQQRQPAGRDDEDSSGAAIEDVIVTAQKRGENLRKANTLMAMAGSQKPTIACGSGPTIS